MNLTAKLKKLDARRAEIAAKIEQNEERQRIEIGGRLVPLLSLDAGLAERLLNSPALSTLPTRGQRFIRADVLAQHPSLAPAAEAAQPRQVQGSQNSMQHSQG